MNKLVKLILAASAVVAISASAQEITDIKASTPTSAYLQDGRGVIVRSVFGMLVQFVKFFSAHIFLRL